MDGAIIHYFRSQDWLLRVIVILAIAFALTFLLRFVNRLLQPIFAKTDHLWDSAFINAVHKPALLYIWFVSAGVIIRTLLAEPWFALTISTNYIFLYLQIITELFIFLTLIKFITNIHSAIILASATTPKRVDRSMGTAFCQLLRLLIFVIAILVILRTLGLSISTLLAFGGVGTLAIGFAAKDTLANFLGGLMVFVDRPFAVGDWIRSPDRDIEGTVEHIGWRLTRIRRFDMRPLYIPNALFSTVSVENPGRMLNRRIKVTIGVRYSDFKKISKMLAAVKEMLKKHPEIDTKRTLMVNLFEIGPSSLNFFLYTFTKTTNWVKYQSILQDVLLKVLDIVDHHDAECAFPTRTLSIPDGVMIKEKGD